MKSVLRGRNRSCTLQYVKKIFTTDFFRRPKPPTSQTHSSSFYCIFVPVPAPAQKAQNHTVSLVMIPRGVKSEKARGTASTVHVRREKFRLF